MTDEPRANRPCGTRSVCDINRSVNTDPKAVSSTRPVQSIMSSPLGVLKVLLLNLLLVRLTAQYCYKMNLLSYRSSDTQFYRLKINLHSNNTISSLTTVSREVPIPMWHLKLIQRSALSHEKIHYNGTIKVCDFWKFVKRVRVFRDVAAAFLQSERGNLSLSCPMPVGRYVVQNVLVPPDSNALKFIYAPHSMYTLFGNVLSMLPNNRFERLCSYEINATISKSC